MSTAQGIAAAFVSVAAAGGAAINMLVPPIIPPVAITDLHWTGSEVVYERLATETVMGTWNAILVDEHNGAKICEGHGTAPYEIGTQRHVWTLDRLTISPMDGRLGSSRRSPTFRLTVEN